MTEHVMRGGRFIYVPIPATAGNVIFNYLPTRSEKRLYLQSVRVTLVCDATVANRTIQMRRYWSYATGAATQMGSIMNSGVLTASQTGLITLGQPVYQIGGSVDSAHHGMSPDSLVIEKTGISGDSTDMAFVVLIGGGVAGDSYSGNLTIWEEPC